jgi:hypothetical protein
MDDSGRSIIIAITALLIADAVIVGLICGVAISPVAGICIGIAALAAPVLIGAPLIGLINTFTGWSALCRAFPAAPIQPDARRGLAPSVGIRWRWLGYGFCVQWAADSSCLHLSLIPVFSALSGRMSIPWTDLDFDESLKKDIAACQTTRGIAIWVPKESLEAEAARRRAAAP